MGTNTNIGSACALDETFYGQKLSVEQFESLFELESEILEMLALNQPLQEILDKICLLAEELVPNALATIMLLDDKGLLQVQAAPNVPAEGVRALNNLEPGPHNGSCGNAIYQEKPVFVENALTDDRWKHLRQMAVDFNLRACWSMPIRSADNQVIGSFALTSFEHRLPNLFQHKVLEMGAHIASIALKRERLESRLKYLAYHDPLTGLFNRVKLEEDVEERIADNTGEPYSLILFGLDRFKAINDAHGHDMGDHVLTAVARCLEGYVKNEFPLYRVGSDEFAILFQRKDCTLPMVENYVKALVDCLEDVIEVDEHQFYLSASVGIACALQKESFYDLMKEADMAMYQAKGNKYCRYAFYDDSIAQKVSLEESLMRDLHIALEQGQFVLYYQPLMEASGQKVRSLEALIRWQHPEKGLVPPFQFIPIAEESGLISKITPWVVQQAIADLQHWHEKGLKDFIISVNISGQEFNFQQIQMLIEMIEEAGLNAFFEFELTEGYFMGYEETSIKLLELIRSHGISIAIDDFGTGYSSLSYLKRFPVNKVKIDQSLVRDIVKDENDQVIVDAVIVMSHALGLKVVAEGVETEAHQAFLENKGVDFLQGYLYAKPKPAVLIDKFLKTH